MSALNPNSTAQAGVDSPIGRPMARLEDERFLRGGGRYVTDLVARAGAMHVAVLRSPHAHARIAGIEVSRAKAMPGVGAVLTADDLSDMGGVPCDWAPPEMAAEVTHPILASGKVHYAGQPVAAVAAVSPEAALDALEAINTAYEPLAPVIDQEAALRSIVPRIHSDAPGNLAFRLLRRGGDPEQAFAKAEAVVSRRIVNNRLVPSPMETRAVLSAFDPVTATLLHHSSSQLPHVHARALATCLGLPLHKLRLIAPDIGGGFGAKLAFYAEDVICAVLSMKTGRPCGWIEGRGETMTATTHGRDHIQYVELAAKRDGTILGMKARLIADLGAFAVGMGPGIIALNAGSSITGPYRIENVAATIEAVYTNRTPTGPYRGAGHPEATYLVERMVEALAAELGRDPADIRRMNLVPASAMPYRLPIGMELDTGDYAANLDKALQVSGYTRLREEQHRARADGRLLGVGIGMFSENSGAAPSVAMGAIGFRRAGHESARVVVHPDGRATVFSGSQSQGQGHATSLAQIAAGVLGLEPEDVEVIQGDTQAIPFGTGTYNSRTMAVGGSAVHVAATRILEKVRRIAAYKLQRRPEDLVYANGEFSLAPSPGLIAPVARITLKVADTLKKIVFQRKSGATTLAMERGAASVSFRDAAREAHLAHDLPLGMNPGLDETAFFNPKTMPFAYGSHVASVEVDAETGHVALLAYTVIDDCGRIINPLLARGQVHGGLAQGIGQALMEGVSYGKNGVMLSTNPRTTGPESPGIAHNGHQTACALGAPPKEQASSLAGWRHAAGPCALQGGFQAYAMPRAMDLPRFETAHTDVPAKDNPLGAKGVGEGATIGAPAAVVHAVLDALAPLGVTDIDMPLTPMTVWRAIRAARELASTTASRAYPVEDAPRA